MGGDASLSPIEGGRCISWLVGSGRVAANGGRGSLYSLVMHGLGSREGAEVISAGSLI